MASTSAFLRQYLRPRAGVIASSETTYLRGREALPATVYRPVNARGRLPGWVLLHGLTYSGRKHHSLVRFAEAVAASGSVVFVPEIPEWKALHVAPAITTATIAAACVALHERADIIPDRTGLIGFSFGATQALISAVDPAVEQSIKAIAAWGGYSDMHRLFRFGITGEYDADGVHYRTKPDPYGGWIMSANYLTAIPGHEHDQALADVMYDLATAAGDSGVNAWDAKFDPLKLELRATLTSSQQEMFDKLAPQTTVILRDEDLDDARALADSLSEAALRTDPLLDPTPFLPRIRIRTLVAHGRDDRLVPFTESVYLHRALSPSVRAGFMITSLFSHSGGTRPELGYGGVALEGVRFVRLLNRILSLV